MRTPLVILLASVLAAPAVLAETYVRVEKDGTKTYSDRPLPGGQPVDIQPAQTYTPPPPPPDPMRTPEQRAAEEAPQFQYDSCQLTPRNDQTFFSPETINVQLTTVPQLRLGDEVRLAMDGAPLEGRTSAVIDMPERGTHSITAQITDRSGRTLCSASSTIHVQRPGLNSPQRRPPPRPTPRPR